MRPSHKYQMRCLGFDLMTWRWRWSHDTCKSADNCNLLFPPNTASPTYSIFVSFFRFLPSLHSILCSFPMKSTRQRATRTIPPALRDDSADFTPFPSDLMRGITEAEPLSMAAEWTNEKHSLYLKSMEASFVNQLYDSKQILGWRSHEDTSLPSTAYSGQFKVLRGGSWHNINFKRQNPHINRANECHDLNASPWIQHFRSSSRQGSVTSPAIEETATSTLDAAGLGQRRGIVSGPPTSSGHIHFCKSPSSKQNVLCDDTEMSDQNFVDEEVEGEEESQRNCNVKRLKSLESEAKYNDQMVPLSK